MIPVRVAWADIWVQVPQMLQVEMLEMISVTIVMIRRILRNRQM